MFTRFIKINLTYQYIRDLRILTPRIAVTLVVSNEMQCQVKAVELIAIEECRKAKVHNHLKNPSND